MSVHDGFLAIVGDDDFETRLRENGLRNHLVYLVVFRQQDLLACEVDFFLLRFVIAVTGSRAADSKADVERWLKANGVM